MSSSRRRHAAAVTSMDPLVLVPLDSRVVGVWVADAVRADTLHDAPVVAPELLPGTHVVIRPSMERTGLSLLLALQAAAYRRLVSHDGTGRAFEGLFFIVGLDTQASPSTDVCACHTLSHARICSHSQAVRQGSERIS